MQNYRNNSAVAMPRDTQGDVKYVMVYNNSTVLTAYKPYNLVPGWITALGVVYVPIAAATNTAVTNLVGVPQTAIAASTYGLVQVQGLVPICATTGTVTANDKLQLIASGVGLIREGSGADGLTIMTTDVCAIAVANVDTNQWQVYLIGALCSIAAS